MDTEIFNRNIGRFFYKSGVSNQGVQLFNTKTLIDFYPLNISYTYRYSEALQVFYLFLNDAVDNLTAYDYGLERNRNTYSKTLYRLDVDGLNLYNRFVSEDNNKVCDFAEQYNIITFRQLNKANRKNISASFKIVSGLEKKNRDKAYDKVEDKIWVKLMPPEERDVEISKHMTEKDLTFQRLCGKIRTMLVMMEKVVRNA